MCKWQGIYSELEHTAIRDRTILLFLIAIPSQAVQPYSRTAMIIISAKLLLFCANTKFGDNNSTRSFATRVVRAGHWVDGLEQSTRGG